MRVYSAAACTCTLLFTLTRAALGQCSDGTPPPCRGAVVPAPRAVLDQNLIAVFPFRVSGSPADAAALREGAMDLLALALDEQAGLRVVSSRTLLARARTFTDASSVADAAVIARALGAGTMILGNAIVVGSQVRARAELHDVMRNRSISSVEARGTAGDPAPIIDSLAAALARVRLTNAGAMHRSIQEFASTSPAALRAYLAAERLGRQGLWQEAADSLHAAIRIDTTFGLAYYRLSVAARYGGVAPLVPSIERALRFQDRLPRRQRDLLHSVMATQRGELREALSVADALAATYPDDPEVAFEQGEAYFHVALPLGEPRAQAIRAFTRAVALDSNLLEPYNHAAEMLYVSGDTAGAWRLTVRALALAPTATVQVGTSMAMRAIRGERPSDIMRSVPVSTALLSRVNLELERMLTDEPARAVSLAEQFLMLVGPDASRGDREPALQERAVLLAARGRFTEALAMAGEAGPGLSILAGPWARTDIASLAGRPRAPDEIVFADSSFPTLLGAAAWNGLLRNDTAQVRRAVAQLRSMPSPNDAFGPALASCVDARQSLGRGDSARAREQLTRISEVRPFLVTSEFTFDCVMLLARLERAAGDLESAYRHLGGANYFNAVFVHRSDMEELRAQIAEQRGDTAAAIRGYRNFVGLWENADPEFQPRVAAARAALSRLGGR